LNSTLEGARGVITTADGVLKNTDSSLLGRDAPVQQDLRDTLQELARAARSLRVFLDYLERYPESLVRGKVEGKP
jgi:paraquat-inducible protein B